MQETRRGVAALIRPGRRVAVARRGAQEGQVAAAMADLRDHREDQEDQEAAAALDGAQAAAIAARRALRHLVVEMSVVALTPT